MRIIPLTPVALAVGVISLAALFAAPVPKEKPKDEEAVRGMWQVVTLDDGKGTKEDAEKFSHLRFEFQDDKIILWDDGKAEEETIGYKLAPTANPKAIDLIQRGHTMPGIYELDGDTLTICISVLVLTDRPTRLKPDGKEIDVLTLKRVKGGKKGK